MNIYVQRGNQDFGPYSLDDVNTYLETGDLVYNDKARCDIEKNWKWVELYQIPGVIAQVPKISSSGRLPPPGASASKRNKGLEILGFLFPPLGLIFWAVYANSEPEKAKNIGIYALLGVVLALTFWGFIVAIAGQ